MVSLDFLTFLHTSVRISSQLKILNCLLCFAIAGGVLPPLLYLSFSFSPSFFSDPHTRVPLDLDFGADNSDGIRPSQEIGRL